MLRFVLPGGWKPIRNSTLGRNREVRLIRPAGVIKMPLSQVSSGIRESIVEKGTIHSHACFCPASAHSLFALPRERNNFEKVVV